MATRIPVFPSFKLLDIEDHEEIDLITRQHPCYSDFNFTNLFCYDTVGDCQVSILHGNLVVRFRNYITQEPFFSFLGHNNVAETIHSLIELSREQLLLPALRLIPESSIRGLLDGHGAEFTISEDYDNFDYLIGVRDLMELASGRWRNKRKAANRFKRSQPKYTLCRLELHDPQTQRQVRQLFHTWAKKRSKAQHETQNELAAIERIMQYSTQLRLVSLGAFIDGRLEGFTFNEVVHDGHYIGLFGKSNPEYTGLTVFLESETARVMDSFKCRIMNYQQDLGLDGLRRFKQLWHPTSYLRKFTVCRRTHDHACIAKGAD